MPQDALRKTVLAPGTLGLDTVIPNVEPWVSGCPGCPVMEQAQLPSAEAVADRLGGREGASGG